MDNMPKLEFLQHAPKDNYQVSFKDEIFMCVQDPGMTLTADPRVITFPATVVAKQKHARLEDIRVPL